MDETAEVSSMTRDRAMSSVSKVGFSDGATEGQSAAFQSSFDKGYKQGFSFGLKIGRDHGSRRQEDNSPDSELRDPRSINCQICLNAAPDETNVTNLQNIQNEQNEQHLSRLEKNKSAS